MYYLSIFFFVLCMYCRKEKEATAYVENFHFEKCKDRYLIMFYPSKSVSSRKIIDSITCTCIYFTPNILYNIINVSFETYI